MPALYRLSCTRSVTEGVAIFGNFEAKLWDKDKVERAKSVINRYFNRGIRGGSLVFSFSFISFSDSVALVSGYILVSQS